MHLLGLVRDIQHSVHGESDPNYNFEHDIKHLVTEPHIVDDTTTSALGHSSGNHMAMLGFHDNQECSHIKHVETH